MTKRFLLTIFLLLGASGAAQAKQCSALPDLTRGSWSWEWVDARICWYLGAAVPKESLRWEAPEQTAALPNAGTARQPAQKTKAAAEPAQKEKVAGDAAQNVQCRTEPEGSGRWTWRTVEGRKCWFVGARDTPRESLHWPREQKRESPDDVANATAAPAADHAPIRVRTVEIAASDSAATEHPEDAEIDSLDVAAEPSGLADAHPWQLVNLEAGGDLEFLAVGEPVSAPLSINLDVGNEFLTRVPVTHWPVLAQISAR
jgi:hypothetical protein